MGAHLCSDVQGGCGLAGPPPSGLWEERVLSRPVTMRQGPHPRPDWGQVRRWGLQGPADTLAR